MFLCDGLSPFGGRARGDEEAVLSLVHLWTLKGLDDGRRIGWWEIDKQCAIGEEVREVGKVHFLKPPRGVVKW